MEKTFTATMSTRKIRYSDTIDDFLEWVREVPLESDAVNNIPLCLARYEKQKTFKQKLKDLFS